MFIFFLKSTFQILIFNTLSFLLFSEIRLHASLQIFYCIKFSILSKVHFSVLQLLMLQKQQEYLEQQKALEEQQAMEKQKEEQERIDQIKNKKKDEESKLNVVAVQVGHYNLLGQNA